MLLNDAYDSDVIIDFSFPAMLYIYFRNNIS
jgi:hypothetical protein